MVSRSTALTKNWRGELSISGSKMHIRLKIHPRYRQKDGVGRGDVGNAGKAKMKGAELPTQHRVGLEWGHCCIKLEMNQPNTKLVCISVPITGRSTSLFPSRLQWNVLVKYPLGLVQLYLKKIIFYVLRRNVLMILGFWGRQVGQGTSTFSFLFYQHDFRKVWYNIM